MGFFDIFKEAETEYQRKFAEGKRRIEAEVGAQAIIDLLAFIDDKNPEERFVMISLRTRADFIRAGLSIWDSLAVKEPQKFTQERKVRISELLQKAMEEK